MESVHHGFDGSGQCFDLCLRPLFDDRGRGGGTRRQVRYSLDDHPRDAGPGDASGARFSLRPYSPSSRPSFRHRHFGGFACRGRDRHRFLPCDPAKFDWVGSFSTNELAVAQLEEGGKKGYLDTWGEWAIPPKFSDADTFSANGLAAARLEDNGKWGYIDSKGEWVIKPQFYEACSFDKNGIAEVQRNKDDYPAFINSKGKVIMQFKDKRDNYERSNGLFYTYRDDDLVIVNMQGEKIVEKNHDCGTAYINHYGTYLLARNREEACREFKKNLQELDNIVTELKNSNTRDEVENGNSDSGLENGTSSEELEHVGLHFESDPGWEVDSVTLDPPQGAMMTESKKVGSRYQIYLGPGVSNRSLAGKYAYSIDLKSNNGNYKQCTGSFKLKNGGNGYTSISVSSVTCGASVHQN